MRQKVIERGHADEGHGVSQKRNVYQRLKTDIGSGSAGQAGGTVGSRASLVDGRRRVLPGDLQPACFRTVFLSQNCPVSSRTRHLPPVPLLHPGMLSMVKITFLTEAFSPSIVSIKFNKSLRFLTWTVLNASVINRIEKQLCSGLFACSSIQQG